MMLHNSLTVARKEFKDYFFSPAAFLFLGVFLIAAYIIFFWVEAFFARNLADLRPLFSWIPILLIFLVSALTMQSWAEERRMGTIELLLTSPIPVTTYIIGKFIAVLLLVGIALVLTFPLAFTVNILGELDWGPVFGGYIASMFLAAAYIAIGLWASSQTDNQIVSLILSITIAGGLYAIGSNTLTTLFDYQVGGWLRSLGSGSRFESITRGVLDLRDIFYYVTIVVIFLMLNRLKLETLRWAGNFRNKAHSQWYKLVIVTMVVFIFSNFALSYITQARVDITQGQIYSLSDTTKRYLKDLKKPLLIRGYFSSSTHPLLAPLIPRIRDLLNEYAVEGAGNVRIEFVDPLEQPKFEEEAGTKYRIRPVSFQTENKYQASVVNTYFNVLVRYGDQYDVLSYKDLVELKASAGRYEVELSNPEYHITRTIQSVVAKSKREVSSFENITETLVLTGYVSSSVQLPDRYKQVKSILEELANELREVSNENFDVFYINPDEDQLTSEYLRKELGVRPRFENDLNAKPYWFYFTLTDGKSTVPVLLLDLATKSELKQSIFAAYKRMLPDTVKTVALMRPLAAPAPAGVGASPGIPKKFSILRKTLSNSVKVIDVDLRDGQVPEVTDLLMVLAPRYLTPAQVSAIKQFLVQGGTVLIASAPTDVNMSYFTEVYEVKTGLEDWLAEYGIKFREELVLDSQHGKLSLPTSRQVGSLKIRETNLINYPYLIDVREEGLNPDSEITANLGQIFVPWTAPIEIELSKNTHRKITRLLISSNNSWTSNSQDILPDFKSFPDIGFPKSQERRSNYLLAAMIEGAFANEKAQNSSSRLILVGSSALFTDNFVDQMTQVLRSEYRRPIQFMQNLVDWSLQDQGLLKILRKHSQFTRTLDTLDENDKSFWEYLNYGFGAMGMIIVWLIIYIFKKISLLRNKRIIREILI